MVGELNFINVFNICTNFIEGRISDGTDFRVQRIEEMAILSVQSIKAEIIVKRMYNFNIY